MGVGRRCPRVRVWDVTVSPRHLLKTNVNFVLAKCYIRAIGYRGYLSRVIVFSRALLTSFYDLVLPRIIFSPKLSFFFSLFFPP